MKAVKYEKPENEVNSVSLLLVNEKETGSNEDPPPIKRWGWLWGKIQQTAQFFSAIQSEELPREFSCDKEPLTRNYWEKKAIEWKL